MSELQGVNNKLILWFAGIAVTLTLGIGTPILSNIYSHFANQQVQIDDNRKRIWEQQRTSITEETLSRRFSEIMVIVDTKIDGIQGLQREQSEQLKMLINSQNEFQRDVRELLREKEDKR